MADQRRLGFTLVELLVVIVIIAVLVGLLLPAIGRSRERARQTECANNQRQLGQALKNYENAKGHLPGYLDSYGKATKLSWLVMILPYLDNETLWNEWRRPDTKLTYVAKRTGETVPEIPQFICPSDARGRQAVLSYVANCGIPAGSQTQVEYPPGSGTMVPVNEGPMHGVFHDRTASRPISMTTDRIPDGAGQTLMFSENLQATEWAPPAIDNDPMETWTGRVAGSFDWREAHVGMVWVLNPGNCRKVNQCREAEVEMYDSTGVPLNPPTLSPPYDSQNFIVIARPSSDHISCVNATYCDASTKPLFDDTDYNVFQQMMAPDDDKAGVP